MRQKKIKERVKHCEYIIKLLITILTLNYSFQYQCLVNLENFGKNSPMETDRTHAFVCGISYEPDRRPIHVKVWIDRAKK